jgi:predicted kinase
MTMPNTIKTLAAAAIVGGLAVFAWQHWHAGHGEPGGHADHAGHAGHGQAAGLSLDDGRKWATDAGLRQGMTRIRALAEAPAPDPAAQAAAIRDEVAALVANCRLEPRADAVLHALIGELLAGAEAMARPETASAGLDRVRAALARYPDYFDHPGWRSAAP